MKQSLNRLHLNFGTNVTYRESYKLLEESYKIGSVFARITLFKSNLLLIGGNYSNLGYHFI